MKKLTINQGAYMGPTGILGGRDEWKICSS